MKKVVFKLASFDGKVIINYNDIVEVSDSVTDGQIIITTTTGIVTVKGSVDEFIKAYKEAQCSIEGTISTDLFEFL
jgi:SepF-like predicted cell division protein (DUF552 family)